MSLPQPQKALNDACSVIFNNTLYTYSADAFQSLRLEPGAEWTELPQGQKVTGGVCVGSTTGTASTSAFFVIGGIATTAEYKGLQKYTYATGQWETITLPVPVTDRRVGHGAVYINSTNSILVYAGAQDGSQSPSSQTFSIDASAPHAVLAFDSVAPPSIKPMLLPWSNSEVVMIGGSTWNTRVMLFSSEKGWVDSGASLAAPLLKDTSAIRAVVATGDDGSKHLITFDMSESPNKVARTVLRSAGGVPVPKAAPVQRRTARRKARDLGGHGRRDAGPLTVDNWPAYNSTLAPTATRNNYALAEGPDGTVVIAGGNGGDDDDVLCMFNARKNCWEDPSEKLAQFRLLSADTSSTTSAMPTPTPTSTTSSSTSVVTTSEASAAEATQSPTEAAAPTVTSSSGPPLNTILGAVLGGVFGLAVLLVLVYLCIRRRRRRPAHAEASHFRSASGASLTEKGGIGFARDSLALGQGSVGGFRGHQSQDSQGSLPPLAILMGRLGEQKSPPSHLSRKPSNDSRRASSDSTFWAFKSAMGKLIPQPQQQAGDNEGDASAASTAVPKERNPATGADRHGSTRRSSGWNRYWSGGSALNLLGFGGGSGNGNGTTNNSRRTTVASDQSSQCSDTHRMTQDSATVPPFQALNEPRMSFSRVTTRSPTIAIYGEKLREGMSGQIETQRPVSAVSELSASAYSSGIPESVHDSWDPTATNKPWGADRALNGPLPGLYSTPLAPASQGPARAQRQQQAPVSDDMSWLKLAGS